MIKMIFYEKKEWTSIIPTRSTQATECSKRGNWEQTYSGKTSIYSIKLFKISTTRIRKPKNQK